MLSQYGIMKLTNNYQLIITRNEGGNVMQVLAAVAGVAMMIFKIGGGIAFWPCVYILMKAAATEAFCECSDKKGKTASEKVEKTESHEKEKKFSDVPIGIPLAIVISYSLYLLWKLDWLMDHF